MGEMQGGRWRELTELVNEVLEVPPAQRSGFLDRLCDDDAVLRAELEALLVAEEEAGDFLLSPIFSLHDDGPSVDEVGRRIGAYRLLRPLGRGGMGTVWLATRDDGVFDQEVAIKILKRGMDTDEIVRRFEAERQILASLVHPGIASLLDGGTTDDGLPYFVMEHVDGRPIDVYCAEQGLGVHQRLELVLEVCEAVAAAHRSLVVHRDLKPANILVDREGHLKLLDFGIAKVLGPDAGPQVTQTRRLAPLTPHYASPEQLQGGSVTTATDVYALGVLLYELLTGRRPFELDTASPEAAVEVVCSRQPTRPSTAVVRVPQRSELAEGDEEVPMGTSPPGAPRQLRKALAGDLDTLVLTAMRKEPERRFPSVDQFAEDIRRHLDGRPIRSRPDTWAYRTSKFLRRHAWGVAATATISILVVGFAVSMAVQRARIANQAEQLAVERDRSESVLDFVLDFLRVSDPKTGGGETLTVREALDSAMVGLDVRLQDDPQTRAALLDTVGSVYRNLALYGLAQRPLEEALELRINALGEDHPEVGESLLNLASLERHLGHDGEASRHLIRAVDVLRSVYPSGHADLATALNNLAALRRSDGKLDVAEDLYREALSMQGTLLGEMHSDTAVTLNNLAVLLTAKGSLEEAETLYRRSVHIRAEVDGPDSLAYATGLNSLGAFLVRTGEAGAAAKLHREALTIRRRRHRGDHPQVATSLHNLADALRRSGQAAEAVEPIEEALAMQLRLTGPEHRRVEKLRAMEERIREAVAAEAASKESVGREEPTGTQVPDGD